MKRILSLLMALLLVLTLCGCRKDNSVSFYYPRTEIQYGIADGVIAAESRKLSDSAQDLEYLLKLYLEGPISQNLRNPFPKGTALHSVVTEDSGIIVTLSPAFERLDSLEHMIACACIASTCFAMTEADSVTVEAGETSLTLTRDTLALSDSVPSTLP